MSEFVKNGAREPEVEEPSFGLGVGLIRSDAILCFEFEEVAEPKALAPSELRLFLKKYGNTTKAAASIRASEAFVRQNSKS